MTTHRNAEEEAQKFIKWTDLPIDLSVQLKKAGVLLRPMRTKRVVSALYVIYGGRQFIVVNQSLPVSEQRFAIARELGHAVMGHGASVFFGTVLQPRPIWQVEQAEVFARELLMPRFIAATHGHMKAKQLAALCDVPLEQAEEKVRALGW